MSISYGGHEETSPRASFVIVVGYPGKEPFWVGSFDMDRKSSESEQYEYARKLAGPEIKRFWGKHLPDGLDLPDIISVKLGHLKFIVDDYEWRRGA